MTPRSAVLALLAAAALGGEAADDLLFRARHAHLVKGDTREAIALYRQALEDTSLSAAQQAEAHLRVALCHEEAGELREADSHLMEHLFAHESVAAEVRRGAEAARVRLEAKRPKEAPRPREGPDPAEVVRARFEDELRKARRFLDSGNDMQALWHVQRALEIDPDDAEARRIDAELETRLSGAADFIRDPLRWVRQWTETRITQVAQEAQQRLAEAVARAEARAYNLAWPAFRAAVNQIDGCEFGQESDRLVVLRHHVVARWDAAHREAFGRPLPEREIEAPPARSTVLTEYLNRLQALLDLVSSKEREYRILPVQAARTRAEHGWSAKPEAYRLFRDLPSTWSPALFARLYLPLRVYPDSWAQRGSYVEAVGDMLVARNRPDVLDALLDEVRRIERPPRLALDSRFLLVPVPVDALARFEKDFGKFDISHRGDAPVLYRAVPARFGLDYLCSWLIDRGADVRPAHDTFAAGLANGVPQTFFVAQPLAPGARAEAGVPVTDSHQGLVLDLYPLQDRTGRTAAGLRLSARVPAPALPGGVPRFLRQESELFADLEPGATLVVAGLLDPFAPRTGELLLLWHIAAPGAGGTDPPAGSSPLGAEVPLHGLLLRQRDFPGPKTEPEQGFVERERLEVLEDRARFLEGFLRAELESTEIAVSAEEAVARVPPRLLEDAVQVVEAMERESARSYVVEVHARAVRTAVLARWLEKEGLRLQAGEGLEFAFSDTPAELLLRTLDPTEPDDVFAPHGGWHKPTALGFQARHLLSARSRTSPALTSEEDLATGETRRISEGLRITVRPYTWRGNRLNVDVELETTAVESDEEQRALSRALPSHRTRFSGTRARTTLDLGPPETQRTALLCRIPHPTASRPERLTEIVVALSVRRVGP